MHMHANAFICSHMVLTYFRMSDYLIWIITVFWLLQHQLLSGAFAHGDIHNVLPVDVSLFPLQLNSIFHTSFSEDLYCH